MSVMDCVRAMDMGQCQRRRQSDVGDGHRPRSLQRGRSEADGLVLILFTVSIVWVCIWGMRRD